MSIKTFQQYLTESPWGTKTLLEIIFSENRLYVPLSSKMLQRIVGPKSDLEMTALHITSIDGIKDLMRIQNSAKSVSCATMLPSYNPFKGIETKGGIAVKVTGKKLFSAEFDATSVVDEQGRRWISYKEIIRDFIEESSMIKSKEAYALIVKARVEIELKFSRSSDLFPQALELHYNKSEKPNVIEMQYLMKDASDKIPLNEKKAWNDFKNWAIRRYYVVCEIVLRKLRDYLDKIYTEDSKLSIDKRYNEYILNYIKIKSIAASKTIEDDLKKLNLPYPITYIDNGTVEFGVSGFLHFEDYPRPEKEKLRGFLKN